ncbi:MAG: hypothetical protein LBQ91_00875 [Oscillospiraceae bacterium]|jgi:hypothetical protein|nr:hypothetical protein [Oscillospiraceae bacterium]
MIFGKKKKQDECGCGHDHSHSHEHTHTHSHEHEHDHGSDHTHEHPHSHGGDCAAPHEHEHPHSHSHEHDHSGEHGHDEHSHDHPHGHALGADCTCGHDHGAGEHGHHEHITVGENVLCITAKTQDGAIIASGKADDIPAFDRDALLSRLSALISDAVAALEAEGSVIGHFKAGVSAVSETMLSNTGMGAGTEIKPAGAYASVSVAAIVYSVTEESLSALVQGILTTLIEDSGK